VLMSGTSSAVFVDQDRSKSLLIRISGCIYARRELLGRLDIGTIQFLVDVCLGFSFGRGAITYFCELK